MGFAERNFIVTKSLPCIQLQSSSTRTCLREVIDGPRVQAVDCSQVDEVGHGGAPTCQGETLIACVVRHHWFAITRDAWDTNTGGEESANTDGRTDGQVSVVRVLLK